MFAIISLIAKSAVKKMILELDKIGINLIVFSLP